LIPDTSFQTSGLYSPVFVTSGTPSYTTQNGAWRKVGNLVVVSVEIVASITLAGATEAIVFTGPTGLTGGLGFNQDIPLAQTTSNPVQAGAPYYFRNGGTSNFLQLHDKDGVSCKASGGNWNG